MEPKAPRRKKFKGDPKDPFPIIQTMSGPYKFTGKFNGFSVMIEKQSEMEKINSMGSFGKGTLSRSYPNFNKKEINILRQRQYDERNKILDKNPESFKYFDNKNVIVIDDSDSDCDEYFKNLKPLLKKQKIPIVETLNLLLEEAYFLMNEKECLKIKGLDDNFFDPDKAWCEFSNIQETFIQNYAVFSFFRNKNWVVKSGLKFGGEYLLYKDGPAYYHASFLVIIDVVNSETKDRIKEICKRTMDWSSLICHNRLTETAAKELLIAQVQWPPNLTLEDAKKSKDCLKDIQIKPILMKRWVPKIERKYFVTSKNKGSKGNKNETQKGNKEELKKEINKRKNVNVQSVTEKKIKTV